MKTTAILLAAFLAAPLCAEEKAKDAAQLRAAVVQAEGAGKRQLLDRLPGMAQEPFGLCRDLVRCTQAPTSLHVAHEALITDAVLALTRPWLNLQKARGKQAALEHLDGALNLKLEGLPEAALSVRATSVPTGGFDVALTGSVDPAKLYARERAAVLNSPL
ncbi:MAG: hypothetical protein AAB320_02760 [Elusimicrobiota bacterium]